MREGVDLIKDFSYDYTQEQGFGFALIGGDSAKPDELMESLFGILQKIKSRNRPE